MDCQGRVTMKADDCLDVVASDALYDMQSIPNSVGISVEKIYNE